MLQHSGKVFFRVSAIDRKVNGNPTVYLDIFERDSNRLIGQMRYNNDPLYSKNSKDVRMAFDVMKTSMISPINGGSQLLEDIIVGGILWLIKDNHYTYDFVPTVYMVVHLYEQDEKIMTDINSKTFEVLSKIGAKIGEKNMWKISAEDINYTFVEEVINRH